MQANEMLRFKRNEMNLNQEAAGLLIQRSTSYISQLETGTRRPSRKLAKTIQEVFKVPMDKW